MNPWLAHLDNLDLQWIADTGIRRRFDSGVDAWIDAPFFVLFGQLSRDACRAYPGSVLGLEGWLHHRPSLHPWVVQTPVEGLVLPLSAAHRARWAQAFSVALAAEGRQRLRSEPMTDETEAVALKFRFVVNRIQRSEQGSQHGA